MQSYTMSLITYLLSIALLSQKSNAECLADPESCNDNIIAPLPLSSYIQTFDVSSCVANNQLKITEITTNYHYQTMTQVSFDFKMELFIPSSLTAFGADDHIENKVATAQTAVTLTTLMPTTGTLQVTFSNLDITLGCNGKYGYQGHFALFTYPINCANFDDFCEALEPIYPRTCAMPNGGSETLFRYDNGMPPPFGLEALNIVSPTEEVGDLRMDMEIAYTNTIQCTCDTSIEMANGDCNSETGFLALFGETITQEFTTDCFSSQPLQSIDIMIGWNVDNMVHQWTTTGPQETFTLVIKDTDNTVRDTIQVLWSSSSVDPAMNFYTETIIFPISASGFFIGCGTDLKWTLSCADCSVRHQEMGPPFYFGGYSPFVVDCPFALHMTNDFVTTTNGDFYAAFELVADECVANTGSMPNRPTLWAALIKSDKQSNNDRSIQITNAYAYIQSIQNTYTYAYISAKFKSDV
eukprot:942305_1